LLQSFCHYHFIFALLNKLRSHENLKQSWYIIKEDTLVSSRFLAALNTSFSSFPRTSDRTWKKRRFPSYIEINNLIITIIHEV
jgi:hypothetical protein